MAINPAKHMVFTDTVRAGSGGSGIRTGNTMSVSVAVENLNSTPTAPVVVGYSMIDGTTGATTALPNATYRAMTFEGDTIHADYDFVPSGSYGQKTFVMQVNPDNSQPEAYMGNNTAYQGFSVMTPLPLSLVSFTGTLKNKDAVLSWTTANEQNVSHFELERSFDGAIFSVINKTSAFNTIGEHSYAYTDVEWAKKSNGYVYYRLKSVDKNGAYSRSQIVKFAVDNNELLIVNAYPNPATSILNLEIQAPKADNYTVKIADITGKTITNVLYKMDAGIQHFKVPVNQLASGAYILSISSKDGVPQQYKFVKQ